MSTVDTTLLREQVTKLINHYISLLSEERNRPSAYQYQLDFDTVRSKPINVWLLSPERRHLLDLKVKINKLLTQIDELED